MRRRPPAGTCGDPTRAGENKGRAIADAVVLALKKIVTDLHSAPD